MGKVLIYMRCPRLPVDDIGHDAFMIRAFGRTDAVSLRYDLPKTVAGNVEDHLLLVPSSPNVLLRSRIHK